MNFAEGDVRMTIRKIRPLEFEIEVLQSELEPEYSPSLSDDDLIDFLTCDFAIREALGLDEIGNCGLAIQRLDAGTQTREASIRFGLQINPKPVLKSN